MPFFQIEYAAKGCRLDHGGCCAQAATLKFLRKDHEQYAEDITALWDRAFTLGRTKEAAGPLAFRLKLGLGTASNGARALEVASAGCEAESAESCHIRGQLLEGKDGVAADIKGSVQAYLQACRLHNAEGCLGFARLHTNDNTTATERMRALFASRGAVARETVRNMDLEEAREALAKLEKTIEVESCDPVDPTDCAARCDAADADSCSRLAVLLAYGKSIAKDTRRSRNLLLGACDAGSAEGCTFLANLTDGDAWARPREGRHVWCAAGDTAACTNQAMILSPSEQATLLDSACKKGNEMACAQRVLQDPSLIKKDVAAAQAQITPACEGGAPGVCAHFANLVRTFDPKSGPIISGNAKKSCDLGVKWACKK